MFDTLFTVLPEAWSINMRAYDTNTDCRRFIVRITDEQQQEVISFKWLPVPPTAAMQEWVDGELAYVIDHIKAIAASPIID